MAVLLAGSFPLVAAARAPDPADRETEAPRTGLAPPPAREDSAAPPDDAGRRFEVEPVTVEVERRSGFAARRQSSATKSALSLRETPQTVSVITQESLEARQVQDFGQALETAAPGHAVQRPRALCRPLCLGLQRDRDPQHRAEWRERHPRRRLPELELLDRAV